MFGLFKKTKHNAEYDDAAKAYVKTINSDPELTDEEMLFELTEQGISQPLACEMVGLFPILAGRLFLQGLGIQFSDTYDLVDADGVAIGSGALCDHPGVIAIGKQIDALVKPEAYQSVALRGAELNAVNKALNSGSKPSNLYTGPVVLFKYEAA
jgi:hypothetical protein